jgi:hypothetical protein
MLSIGDEIVDHQAAINDLRIEAVAVQVCKPELGSGGPRLRPWGVMPFKAIAFHLIDVAKCPLLVLEKPRSDAIPHALVMPFDEPVQAIVKLFDAGHEEFPLGRGLGGPEIRRAVGQIDVVVS